MKTICFDLDDTLYKSSELRSSREKAILNFLGSRVPEYLSLRSSLSTIKSLEKLGYSLSDFYNIIRKVPINLPKDNLLISMLRELKYNYQLIIVSNSPSDLIESVLKSLGIFELIDKIYAGDNLPEVKPSEKAFTMIQKGDICVGNNFKKDLLVPKNKRALTVLVSDKPDSQVDYTIKSIYELKEILDLLEKTPSDHNNP